MNRSRNMAILNISLSIVLLTSCKQNNKVDVVVVGNGIEIPIDACVEVNGKIFGNSIDPAAFCKCLIPKMYAEYKDDPEKIKFLKEGKFDLASKGETDLVTRLYNECITQSATTDSNARLTITPRMEAKIKDGIKKSFAGTDFEITNDIDAYCNCMITGMQTELSAKEVMQNNAADSLKMDMLREKCGQSTRKK